VKIETSEGRREYEAEQRKLAEEARNLRETLIDSLRRILSERDELNQDQGIHPWHP
jgi:hypothetical protein